MNAYKYKGLKVKLYIEHALVFHSCSSFLQLFHPDGGLEHAVIFPRTSLTREQLLWLGQRIFSIIDKPFTKLHFQT